MSLFAFFRRCLQRLLGTSPPEIAPSESIPSIHECEVRETFARAALDVWSVECENLPGETWVKVGDCDGFGNALRLCAKHALKHHRTTEYVVFNDVGLRVCKVRVEIHYDAAILNVIEWVHPALLRIQQVRQAQQYHDQDVAA